MLVSLSEVLKKARRGRYAVGAFNVNNLETLQSVMAAAEAERAPVVVQTSEGAIQYAGMDELALLTHMAAMRTKCPVVFHLDHGKNEDLVVAAIRSGYYTSVMYDGSSLPYEENVRTTREIVRMAHAKKISVEAELGAIAGAAGAVAVCAGPDAAAAARVLSRISKKFAIVKSDLSSFESLEYFIGEVKKITQNLDYLVFNAGVTKRCGFEEINIEDWMKIFNANVRVNFILSKEVVEKEESEDNPFIKSALDAFKARVIKKE